MVTRDSLLVQIQLKNLGTTARIAFNTAKFHHPIATGHYHLCQGGYVLPSICLAVCLPVINFMSTGQILTKISPPEIYPVDTEKLQILCVHICMPIQEFLKRCFSIQDMAFFYNLPHISEKKTNWIFMKILSQMYLWSTKSPVKFLMSSGSGDADWIHLGGGVTCSYLTRIVLLQWHRRCQRTGNISPGDTALNYTFTYCQDLYSVWCAFCAAPISFMHMDCFQ